MPENSENLVLERLRPMRVAVVDRIEQRLDDLTIRVGHLETSFAHMQTNLAHVQVQLGSNRFASIVSRQGSPGSKKGLNWLMRKVPG